MIFVSVGTVSFQFQRLVKTTIKFAKLHSKQKVFIQYGVSKLPEKLPPNLTAKKFISYQQTKTWLKKAKVIVAAAGEAFIFDANRNAVVKPILFPRRKKFSEHVDDQQLLIAKKAQKMDSAQVALSQTKLFALMSKPQLPKTQKLPTNSAKQIAQEIKNKLKLN